MRNRKFRAYDKIRDEMYYDNFVIYPKNWLCEFPEWGWDIKWETEDPKNFILMDYTGWDDDNWKNIFEWDILAEIKQDRNGKEYTSIIWIVIFWEYEWTPWYDITYWYGYFVLDKNEWESYLKNIEDRNNISWSLIEVINDVRNNKNQLSVIGNIFENFELIKKTDIY